MKEKIIFFRESLAQSLIADAISFTGFVGLMTLNYMFWDGAWYTTIAILIIWGLWSASVALRNKSTVFTSRKDLIKYLQENSNHD